MGSLATAFESVARAKRSGRAAGGGGTDGPGGFADVLGNPDSRKGAKGYRSTNAKGNTSMSVIVVVRKNSRAGCHDGRAAVL